MSIRLPAAVQGGVTAALERHFGRTPEPLRVVPVAGGCVSPVARVETAAGDVAFVKWSVPGQQPPGMLAAEAVSLRAMAAAGAVRVPAVLGIADPEGEAGWLLLEWLEPGRAGEGSWAGLGRALAALHRTRATSWGWPEDNFIGPLPQENGALEDWPSFWRARRLEPQLRRAYDAGYFDAAERRRFDALLERLDASLVDAAADGASLLHGDLWSGNVHVCADGVAALVDPAAYHGHREVDLAMAELFGGFDVAFYDAYDEAWPVAPEYRAVRRPIYQLYYLLVHVNLFGGGYVARTLDALGEAGE